VTNGRGSRRRAEQRSLELVQRMIISALVAVVFGSLAVVLAAYLAVTGDQDLPRSSVIGLWVMTGVIGLLTAAAVLMINRRRPYSPLVALGLLPMLVVAYWIFT
jgi:heme/copper-type cytochrome/quinol oxidase subunit 2